MLRIITLNLNGIRSAWSKGLLAWAGAQGAQAICLQELKALASDLSLEMWHPPGLHAHYRFSDRKGYSGVGIWSARPPDRVVDQFGSAEFDPEGRYLRADFGRLSIVSLYQPSGSTSAQRQEAKYRFMAFIYPHLLDLASSGRDVVVCGDWNIAHQEMDLKNWRGNRRHSGFLPAEREWLSLLLSEGGWCDVFRRLYPQAAGEGYTWWSNRGQAWARNVGWRIDYQLATPALADRARRATVFKEQRFSDHAPLTIDYDYTLSPQIESN